jgi:hypothetical protein
VLVASPEANPSRRPRTAAYQPCNTNSHCAPYHQSPPPRCRPLPPLHLRPRFDGPGHRSTTRIQRAARRRCSRNGALYGRRPLRLLFFHRVWRGARGYPKAGDRRIRDQAWIHGQVWIIRGRRGIIRVHRSTQSALSAPLTRALLARRLRKTTRARALCAMQHRARVILDTVRDSALRATLSPV